VRMAGGVEGKKNAPELKREDAGGLTSHMSRKADSDVIAIGYLQIN